MNVYTRTGTDLSSESNIGGTIGFNGQVASRGTGKDSVIIHNAGAARTGSEELTFLGYGSRAAAYHYIAQIGTTWYASEAIDNGVSNDFGTGTGNDAPVTMQGFTTTDTVWYAFETGDNDLSNSYTLPDFAGTTGAALPAGMISNTGILANGTDSLYFKSYAVIPEPATLGLIAAFGGAVLFIRRRFMI